MSEEQPTFKVVDRRPFNPDGTPRELSPEEKAEVERAAATAEVESPAPQPTVSQPAAPAATQREESPRSSAPPSSRAEHKPTRGGGDPLDDPASFLSLIMSLA